MSIFFQEGKVLSQVQTREKRETSLETRKTKHKEDKDKL
jgi:hypothetical protein